MSKKFVIYLVKFDKANNRWTVDGEWGRAVYPGELTANAVVTYYQEGKIYD